MSERFTSCWSGRHRYRIAAGIAVAVSLIAGCSGSSTPTTLTTVAVPDDAEATTLDTVRNDVDEETSSRAVSVVTASEAEVATSTPSASVEVEVAAAALPISIASAIRSAGGELATTDAWLARVDVAGLPVLRGDDLHLVEAEVDVRRLDDDRWQRVDAMQWIFASANGDGRDVWLDRIAGDARVTTLDRHDQAEIVDTARCVTRSYTGSDAVSWQLQGCDYPTFPGLVAVGFTRTMWFDIAPTGAVSSIEPTVGTVAGTVSGVIVHERVSFGAPSGGSAATVVTTVDIAPASTVGDVGGAVTAALDGWTSNPGEAGAIVLSGSPGRQWVIAGDLVRFAGEGRLT